MDFFLERCTKLIIQNAIHSVIRGELNLGFFIGQRCSWLNFPISGCENEEREKTHFLEDDLFWRNSGLISIDIEHANKKLFLLLENN